LAVLSRVRAPGAVGAGAAEATNDVHALKFTEITLQCHTCGAEYALAAAWAASTLAN